MAIDTRRTTFIDATRSIKASRNFAGASTRRLDATIAYPTHTLQHDRSLPLLVYSHGTWGHADDASCITQALANEGYVVVSPNYPLTSCTSFTKIERPDISDVFDQIKDVTFIIDQMLADDFFGSVIDAKKIGVIGHSLGAVTSYFATFGAQTLDRRIAATALTGAGDPVQAALSSNMGLVGTSHSSASVPTLFLTGEHDLFARMTGGQYAAYARISNPKYQVMIKGGVHSWFHDGDDAPVDGKNPDCLFFERMQPTMKVPGCEERVALIGAARQREISLAAIRMFFDGYLKGDSAAIERLRRLDQQFAQIDVTYE